MSKYSELETLGGQKWALEQAQKIIKNKAVKLSDDERQLAEIRAQLRRVKRNLRQAAARAQMQLDFYLPAPLD